MPVVEDFEGERLKMRAITHFLDSHPLAPDASDIDISRHARGRVMQLLGALLGDKSGTKVKLIYLEFIRDMDIPTAFSWGSAVLASLYRALCRSCHEGVKQIYGPLLLLQIYHNCGHGRDYPWYDQLEPTWMLPYGFIRICRSVREDAYGMSDGASSMWDRMCYTVTGVSLIICWRGSLFGCLTQTWIFSGSPITASRDEICGVPVFR